MYTKLIVKCSLIIILVAIIRLDSPAKEGVSLSLVRGRHITNMDPFIIAGFGATNPNRDNSEQNIPSTVLQYMYLNFVEDKFCKIDRNNKIHNYDGVNCTKPPLYSGNIFLLF